MKIKEVSELTGLTAVALRYYEKNNLIGPITRENGIRNYNKTDLETINFVKCMRDAGVSVKSLVEYMNLFHEKEDTTEIRKKILEKEQQKLKDQIKIMQHSVDILEHKIELYNQGEFKNVK